MGVRTNFVAALENVLETYQTANPTLLRRVYRAHPGGFSGELPAAYVGRRDEDIRYTGQIRQREFRSLEVVLVDEIGWDPQQPADRLDLLTDAIVDAFDAAIATERPSGGILEMTAVRDDEITATGPNGTTVIHRAVRIVFGRASAQEGRA